MKKHITFAILALSGAVALAAQTSPLDLEPCINGGVSAKGDFAEQALEDLAASLTLEDALDLEPCINGGVSASGLYIDQSVEDAVQAFRSTQR